MNSKTDQANEQPLISFANFDPHGNREAFINSPRSLAICEKYETSPEDLFIWDLEEFTLQLKEQQIETENVKAAYKRYLKEMQKTILQMAEERQELIGKETVQFDKDHHQRSSEKQNEKTKKPSKSSKAKETKVKMN